MTSIEPPSWSSRVMLSMPTARRMARSPMTPSVSFERSPRPPGREGVGFSFLMTGFLEGISLPPSRPVSVWPPKQVRKGTKRISNIGGRSGARSVRLRLDQEPVSHPRLGADVARIGGLGLQLAAQRADVHTDRIHRGRRGAAPDRADDLAESDRTARLAGQQLENGEFSRRQAHLAPALGDQAAGAVDLQLRKAEHLGSGVAAAAAELGTDAGEQLAERKGFGHVIVGAEIESPHFVLLLAPYRKDEDRRGIDPANRGDHRHAIAARHGQVGDHQIGPMALEQLAPLLTIGRGESLIAGQRELAGEQLADRRIVVDRQEQWDRTAHAVSSGSSGAAGRMTRAIVPPPGRSISFSEPPCASAKLVAMRRPSPPELRSPARTPIPRSRTSRRTLPERSGSRDAASSRGASTGVARAAFSSRLTRISAVNDGSARRSGQPRAMWVASSRRARTGARLSREARKRLPAGMGSGRGRARPASRRARASRLSIRRASRACSTASPCRLASTSGHPARRLSRLSISRRMAVNGVRKSWDTARSSAVLSASLSRTAWRWAASVRRRSRSTARARRRAAGSRTSEASSWPRTTRTPPKCPPSRSGRYAVKPPPVSWIST